eukprot:scaffold75696_cov37-Prasinocladus_malaysianus.AAC.1
MRGFIKLSLEAEACRANLGAGVAAAAQQRIKEPEVRLMSKILPRGTVALTLFHDRKEGPELKAKLVDIFTGKIRTNICCVNAQSVPYYIVLLVSPCMVENLPNLLLAFTSLGLLFVSWLACSSRHPGVGRHLCASYAGALRPNAEGRQARRCGRAAFGHYTRVRGPQTGGQRVSLCICFMTIY